MYRYLDKLLAEAKKKVRTEFNRMSVMGFDELNVINTRKATAAMFDRFLEDNEAMYTRVVKDAYAKATKDKKGDKEEIGSSFVESVLLGYNLVTGYLYEKEAERKRLRLNEQILTAREYGDRQMYQDSLRRTANLWWTQTAQYGIDMVDKATIKGFRDMGVRYVRWVTANDEKRCEVCGKRHNKIYRLDQIPPKPHYGCRCYVVPVTEKEYEE
jgi:SPP1 gp7 family putative phage head morphogenesis protein